MSDDLIDLTQIGIVEEEPTEESRQCESCNELLLPHRRPGSIVYVFGEWVCPSCGKVTTDEDNGPIRESMDPGTDFKGIAAAKKEKAAKKNKRGGLEAPDEEDNTPMISFGKRDPSYDNVIEMSIRDREEHQHQRSPPDFEGDFEDRMKREAGKYGVQDWQEATFNPVTGKTITRYYGNKSQRWHI